MDKGHYGKFFTRPLSLILLLVAVFCIVWPYISEYLKKRRAAANKLSETDKAAAKAASFGEVSDD